MFWLVKVSMTSHNFDFSCFLNPVFSGKAIKSDFFALVIATYINLKVSSISSLAINEGFTFFFERISIFFSKELAFVSCFLHKETKSILKFF